jgi:hypothetical protein
MNLKIFSHICKKLCETWHLPKHACLRDSIGPDLDLTLLPWTPARKERFQTALQKSFGVDIEITGTIQELTDRTDQRYLDWFFGQIWQPRTDMYQWTGWKIAEEINKSNPNMVLDVGCGYNPFKKVIPGLVGIDPYNSAADYMVDILEYDIGVGQHDHIIALGSINFNGREDVEPRFAKVVELLAPGGKLWMRANPGLAHNGQSHPANIGPWVDIFPWSFAIAHELADKYQLHLETLKKDNDRLFFLFVKK